MSHTPQKQFPSVLLVALCVVIALFIAGSVLFYNTHQATYRRAVAANLRSIAELKVKQITNWQRERIGDAAVLMERLSLIRSVHRFLADSNPTDAAEIFRRLRTVKERYQYTDILLVDLDKQVRFSVRSGIVRRPGAYAAVIDQAMATKAPVSIDFTTSALYPEPHLAVIAPLFLKISGEAPVGALLLISNAREFLYPLLQSWPTPSDSAETLLVRKSGRDVLFLNELRHQNDTALKLRIPITRTDLPAAMVVSGRRGFVEGKDYRGVAVAAYVLPVPDTPWFMVAKLDRREAFSQWQSRAVMFLLLMFCALGLIVVLALVWRQHSLKTHFRALYQSETALAKALQRHSITLQSIGDAVIGTDARGRVELMNPAAEALTGWDAAEAKDRPVGDVFHIVDEESGETLDDPVVRVLREGVMVHLTRRILLLARDGRKVPIIVNGAPMSRQDDEILGVVLVFKDQTQENLYQKTILENEKTYRLLADNSLDAIWTMSPELVFTYINPAVTAIMGYAQAEWIGTRLKDHCDEQAYDRMVRLIRDEMLAGADGTGFYFETVLQHESGEAVPLEIHGKVLFDQQRSPVSLQGVARDISERVRAEKENQRLQKQLFQAQKMESVARLAGGVAHDYNNILSVIIGYTELSMEMALPGEPLHENLSEVLNAANRSRAVTHQLLAFARKETIAPEVLDLNATVESMLKMIRRLIGEDIHLTWKPGKGLGPVKMDPTQVDQILANLCVNARDAIAGVGNVGIETDQVCIDDTDSADFAPGDYVTLTISDDGSGMDKEAADKIFDPFYTTKALGEGTGLGLSTVYGIIKQNHGFINVYSEPDNGTIFRIYLPLYAGELDEQRPKQPAAELPMGKGETILVVEDERSMLKLTRKMLERLDYRVLAANSPAEALNMAADCPDRIALLMTDIIMPEMNGRDLADRLQENFPDLKSLYMSGYTADVIGRSGVVESGVNFIQKPFFTRDLANKLSAVLDGA